MQKSPAHRRVLPSAKTSSAGLAQVVDPAILPTQMVRFDRMAVTGLAVAFQWYSLCEFSHCMWHPEAKSHEHVPSRIERGSETCEPGFDR